MAISPLSPRRSSIVVLSLLLGFVVLSSAGCPRRDSQPPGNVTAFLATPGDSQITLTWANPGDSDFAGVKVLRKVGSAPAGPNDGSVIHNGPGQTALDQGLTNGTRYYYAAYAYDRVPNYASGVQVDAVPTVGTTRAETLEEFGVVQGAVSAAQVPSGARTVLENKLDEAEALYRGGQPCASAGKLAEYETDAQGYRQSAGTAATAGAFEELYALGRRLRYDMVQGTSLKELCAGQERVGEPAAMEVDEDRNSNSEFESSIEFGEPKFLPVRMNGEVFTQLEIPGSDSVAGEPGTPGIPMFRRIVAVPDGAQLTVEASVQAAETIRVNLVPVQLSPADAPLPDPSVFANRPFTQNTALYQSNAPYPPSPVKVTELGYLRDLRVVQVEVASGEYLPQSDTLTLYRGVSVGMRFTGGSGYFVPSPSQSLFEGSGSLYLDSVANRSAVSRFVQPPYVTEILGQEFMILTPTAFRSAADTLATWKRSRGISTRVFEVGTGTDYVTRTQIVNLIKNQYDYSIIRPAYVLLLGNTSFIPTHYIDANDPDLVGSDTIATDFPYAAIGLLGILPRLAVGRLPVRDLTQANRVVARIMAYEGDPPFDANFYRRASIASQFQCCRNETGVHIGTDQRSFIETSEFARNLLIGRGYTVDRIYTRTVDDAYPGDATPRRYFDGTLLPAGLGAASGFAWGGDTADIRTAWNAGRVLFIHRDHGWPGGWADPAFDWNDASALTNGALLPVVFSVNCASGLFDQETAGGALGTMTGTAYFAERLLTNANGGAIGMLGDTRNSPSWANSALMRGFMDAIWPNAIPDFGGNKSRRRLGDILNHGKIYLLTQAGVADSMIRWADAGDEFRLWHCLGDPTLEIWTNNPNRGLSRLVDIQFVGNGLHVAYGVEGASLTAFQFDDHVTGDYVPVGRGIVEDGVAAMEMVGTALRDEPLRLTISLDDAVAVELDTRTPD